MGAELLPNNATAWERALADALDTTDLVSPAIAAIRGTKLVAPPPSFLPFLIYEYGLGELTPYVPNLYSLIAEGIDWQRLRGTPAAIALALSWLGYTARIEEESSKRRYWNLFQLQLDRVRDHRADLDRLAGVASLSAPKRSIFWRGFNGFDIRPLTFSESHYGESHYGEYSGVRLGSTGPLWSFGRQYGFDVSLSRQDLIDIGVWQERYDLSVDDFGFDMFAFEAPGAVIKDDTDNSGELTWGDFTWNGTEASWSSSADRARAEAMATGTIGRRVWFAFLDSANAIIGYRRARTMRFVTPVFSGAYEIGGAGFDPKATVDTRIYVECQTDFGDGDGKTAASFGLVFDATPINTARPGQMWLRPDEVAGGTAPVAVNPIDIAFGESIRERVKLLLRF